MNWINHLVVTTLPAVPKPIVHKVSRRYIAGDTLDDAVRTIRQLEEEGCCATVDILGEHISRKEEARAAVKGYLQALERIHTEKIDSNVSVKLTQMGLGLDEEFCFENIREVVETANNYLNFVRIDMEDSPYTTATLRIFTRLRQEFENVGIVIQAYLRRSIDDIQMLTTEVNSLNVRLCKGIYDEPRTIAYKDPWIINENYVNLLTRLFEKSAYVGIATHDERLVWHGLRLIEKMNLPREKYEFQMLLGVDEELRRIIVKSGHKLRVYVPFGKHWYAYSVRRLKENPQIAGYIIKNFFH